jgi:large subunit ribosomal protein L38
VEINLDVVKDECFQTSGPYQLKKIADHYGIYNDLFGKYAYFVPRVQLNINFPGKENEVWSVHNGNRLMPADLKSAPNVSYDPKFSLSYKDKPEENTLWTLVLTNPDGHLTENKREYVHWMVTNIPNADISKGETLVPYLQPLPLKGTGYHRFIFVLYKQNKKLDLSNYKVTDTKDLSKRTFYTFDFYRNYQDSMTPTGLAFFQAKWDDSIKTVFHEQFGEFKKKNLIPQNFIKNNLFSRYGTANL